MALYKVPELTDFQWQTPVTNQTTNTPPSVAKGARYIVGSSPTDAWVGYSKYIATYNGSSWDFTTPIVGMICYITAESLLYIYSGSVWGVFSASQVGLGNVTNNAQVIADGTVNPTNLAPNGNFELFTKGISVAPDGWFLVGSGATTGQYTSLFKIGTRSVKLQRVTNNCYLRAFVQTEKGLEYFKNRTFTFGCWVYATAANTTYINVSDQIVSSVSSYHTGNSTWQWLTVTKTISASATSIELRLRVDTTDTTSLFDGAIFTEGASAFAFSAAPADITVKQDGTVNTTNELFNGNFEYWSNGASSAPDAWTLVGAGSSVDREASIIKLGTYSAKLTYVSNSTYIYNNFHTEKGIAYWRGRTVTFGCWVYATVASRALINIRDSVGNSEIIYHTGGGTWEWLQVSRTIDAAATTARVECYIFGGATTAYFDGAILVEGYSAFAYSQKPLAIDKAAEISTLTDKTTPVDADVTLIEDSAATPANQKKKLSWTNIKATLKTYFDSLYTLANLGGVPTTRTVNGYALSSNITLGASDVGAVAKDGTVSLNNIIPNGDFENWSAGTSVAPDSWTLGGSAGLAIAREATIKKINSYSLKLTTASLTGNAYSTVKYIAGRAYTYSCWVYATAGSTARLSMYDGVTQTYSSYHTGNSTWQQLTMSQTLSASATTLVVYVDINATSSSAYFDGAMCVEGASAFAYSAHAPDEGVWLDYSAVSTIIGWTSFTHKKIYIKVVGNLVHVLYYIEGQSDSTSTSFTVPYTSKNVADLVPYGTTGYAQDAGVLAVSSGIYGMLNNSTTITFYKNNSQPAWTNSSTKAVVGVLYYEKA